MKTLIIISGPTASGKTSTALKLAQFYKSEIISADSRQFYRGMSIGTAKPSHDELKSIPHHFIDFLNVNENYNIGKFEVDVIALLERLFLKHNILFLTGGSGLYIDAVCNGIDVLPEGSDQIRAELSDLLASDGISALQQKLKEEDPEYYSQIDIQNPHRLIRALEILLTSGNKPSQLRTKTKKLRNFTIKKIGLLADRNELYNRINDRVDQMIEKGLEEEVKGLIEYRNENALQTVGYKEIFDYIDNKLTLEEAIAQIKQNTRNYAKRQLTWFRKDKEIHSFAPEDIEGMIKFIDDIET